MKHIAQFINESFVPYFADAFLKRLKSLGIKGEITTVPGPFERDEMDVTKDRSDSVYISWKNGKTRNYPARTMLASSALDREDLYIAIRDKFKNEKLKGLFDELMVSGLTEATDGKTAQWGCWRFAIRSLDDINVCIKALKNNKLI